MAYSINKHSSTKTFLAKVFLICIVMYLPSFCVNAHAITWSTPVPILDGAEVVGFFGDTYSFAVDANGNNWYMGYCGPDPSGQFPQSKYISNTGGPYVIADFPYDCWDPEIDVDSNGKLHAIFWAFPPASLDGVIMYTTNDYASLAFREGKPPSSLLIPGWDHVGLYVNNRVYESHKCYASGQYYDPLTDNYVPISEDNGVQWQHTLGSFRHDSIDPCTSPVGKFEEVLISKELAQEMRTSIETKQSAGYIKWYEWPLILQSPVLSPYLQKGVGGTFSCNGLIEWAAETSGHNEGQGFIPNVLEYLDIPGIPIPSLTPQLLYWAAKNPNMFWNFDDWLHGILDPVDFILTDPLGRRIGYTEHLGLIAEIPGSFYTGDDALEQFIILDPLPGDYTLELFGLGEESLAAISSSTDGSYFSGFLQQDQTINISVVVGSYPADLDGNGRVDFFDFAILGNQWLQEPGFPSADIAPFGGDCIVDFEDLSEFCKHWLEGTTP